MGGWEEFFCRRNSKTDLGCNAVWNKLMVSTQARAAGSVKKKQHGVLGKRRGANGGPLHVHDDVEELLLDWKGCKGRGFIFFLIVFVFLDGTRPAHAG